MKIAKNIILSFALVFLLTSCGQKDNFVSGVGDVEPPHLTEESELAEYIKTYNSENETGSSVDCYYKTVVVPEDLSFAFIRPQNVFIGWYYNYPGAEAAYPYFTWTMAKNGQEHLEFDIANEQLQQLDGTDYYYSVVPNSDWPDIEAICAVVWVQDGYDFRLNIPVKNVMDGDKLDTNLVILYTQLEKNGIIVKEP